MACGACEILAPLRASFAGWGSGESWISVRERVQYGVCAPDWPLAQRICALNGLSAIIILRRDNVSCRYRMYLRILFLDLSRDAPSFALAPVDSLAAYCFATRSAPAARS